MRAVIREGFVLQSIIRTGKDKRMVKKECKVQNSIYGLVRQILLKCVWRLYKMHFMHRRRILCTLQLISWFLISFVMGGAARAGRTSSFMHLLLHPPSVWPWNLEFFGPQMALANRLDAISQGPKNSRIPGPNPLPLPLVMDMHASKSLCTGLFKS
jgi:hypothetical protein